MSKIVDQLGMAGKTAVILGGGQGNGEATCRRFADAGCNLAIVDLDLERAEKVAADCRARGVKAIALTGDMREAAESQRVVDETAKQLDVPDYLVTIIGQATMKSVLDLTAEDLERDFALNFRFYFFAVQAFARSLIAAGKPGAIASLSSIDGILGSPVHGAYGVAKAGMINLVRTCAIEWADHGIRVNVVAPGAVVTPRVQDSEARRQTMRDSMVPLRRSGQPEEIAGALLFLCSDLSSYMTGQTLSVDGGWSITNLFNAARDVSQVIMNNGAKF